MALLQPFQKIAQAATARHVGRSNQAVILMVIVSTCLLGGLGTRLAFLQLVQGGDNHQRAENNRIRLLAKPPERGRILDRQGRVLAGSTLSHSVFLWPVTLKQGNPEATIQRLAQILQKPAAEIKKKLAQKEDGLHRVKVARNIDARLVTVLAEASSELPGVEVDAETARVYPNRDLAAHVLGYTGELNEAEYKQLEPAGYRMDDVNGKTGAEQAFETQLRGEWGGQQVEVDGAGKVLRVLGEKATHAGKDVVLTLDLDLQKAAEQALGGSVGSIVALNPNTGEVLAMVSHPGYDPNLLSGPLIKQADWDRLNRLDHPFVNRALQGFPPASTFKIVTTTAGLESGGFSPDTWLATYPSLTIGGVTFGEWNHAGFGPLNFAGAMTNSSDTFFYQVANKMGGEPLIHWARRYGFGSKTGIELSEEDPGIVPDEAWKRKVVKEGWVPGDAINMSIGQGYLTGSPLQVAVMFAAAANGGFRVKPHLWKDNPAGKGREALNLKKSTLDMLHDGLRGVVTEGSGTILNVGHLPPLAGKSGTAEDLGNGSHTWFGVYGPVDRPEIVVVAFGELSGGSGGQFAAPLTKQVLEAYFNRPKPQAASQHASQPQ
jgi:penicillin-binding protein 2